jgi:hypothetical protein
MMKGREGVRRRRRKMRMVVPRWAIVPEGVGMGMLGRNMRR